MLVTRAITKVKAKLAIASLGVTSRATVVLAAFAHDRRGATSTEYALIAGFLSIVILFGVTNVGQVLLEIFTNTAAAIE